MIRHAALTAVVLILLCGCSSFFSGEAPQPVLEESRQKIRDAALVLPFIPSITAELAGKKPKLYIVAFDGTRNDKEHINTDTERKTIVAKIADDLAGKYDVDYVHGPGTASYIDAAVCTSCIPKAEEALNRLREKVNNDWNQDPDKEIRVFVTGFSRGAAIGRHFMNMVSRTWPSVPPSSENTTSVRTVRTMALLFDTVATGKVDKLDLGIAPTTDFLIHLISRDERRELFCVTRDRDKDFFTLLSSNMRHSKRMIELVLPGVHSDIGASYLDGIGTAYRMVGERILSELDLIDKSEWILEDDVFSQGAHDSRGDFDKILGVSSVLENPGGKRCEVNITSNPISAAEKDYLVSRIDALTMANLERQNARGQSIEWRKTLSTIKFVAIKKSNELLIQAASYWILPRTIHFTNTGKERVLVFGIADPDGDVKMSRLSISDKVWMSFPSNGEFAFEVVILQSKSRPKINFVVNGHEVESLDVN